MTDRPSGQEDRPDSGAPAGRGLPARRVVFAIVALALFMSTVDATIVATALPSIHRSLHTPLSWTAWTITIYGLGMVIALPVAGRLSDQFGRRRVFLVGIVIFTVASLLCGFSSDIYVLIVFRALQAIGGGAFQPSAVGLVSDHFGRDRDRAVGMFGTIGSTGSVVGPVAGGVLVGFLSWRWIFFVNVPIGVILLALTFRYIPESSFHDRRRIDALGLLLTGLFVLAAIISITSLGNGRTAIDDPVVVVPALFAVVMLYASISHSIRAAEPFIPIRLLWGRGFSAMNLENFLMGATGFGAASLVPLYAEDRYGFRPLDAGTLLTSRAIGMLAIGTFAVFTLRRTGYRLPLIVGFSLVALGLLLISIAPRWGVSPYIWLSASAGIAGLGTGATSPSMRNASLQLSPENAAAITGLRSMFINLGVIFGVSIATAILSRSPNLAAAATAQAHIYWVIIGVIAFVMIPLVYRVPEHKGAW